MGSSNSSIKREASEPAITQLRSSYSSEHIERSAEELRLNEGSSALVGSGTELTSRTREENALNCLLWKICADNAEDGDIMDINGFVCGLMDIPGDESEARPGDNDIDELRRRGAASYLQYQRSGNIEEISETINCLKKAVDISPEYHMKRLEMFTNLGAAYQSRYGRLGDLVDLDNAIEYSVQAVSLTPNNDPRKQGVLSNLAISYRTRFELLGKLADLHKAIECGTVAASLTPDDHAGKPGFLNNLVNSYQTWFERLGEPGDLNKAIEYAARAVSLMPDGHELKPDVLSTLGVSYSLRARYERLSDMLDLNKAIECGTQAVSLTHDGHPHKPGRLHNLGASYQARFGRLGKMIDLNEAIQCSVQAVSLIPDDHPSKSMLLNGLAVTYGTRFNRLGELADLNKSIKCGAQAVSLAPNNHADTPCFLSGLGISYRARFERLGELVDLDKAIECGVRAVSLTPDGHTDKSGLLSNLGSSYLSRFKHSLGVSDLEFAIECGVQAVLLLSDHHAGKPLTLSNLGLSYQTRFELLKELADLDKAIECNARAALLTPDGHADRPGRLYNLGSSYSARYDHILDCSDLESSIRCYEDAARSLVGPPSSRFHACLRWARLSSHPASASSPYPAYMRVMGMLPQLVWIGTTLDRRYSLIAEVGNFATEAAAYAISINNNELALEWLEAGRSIVWGQIAQLRTPFDQIANHDPYLATQLKDIGERLENAGSRSSSVLSPELEDKDLDREASEHIQLALQWDTLLTKVRSVPGFEDFLQPLKSDKLFGVSRCHPVAIINVSESRCDALIIQPNSTIISHVPLTQLSGTNAIAARSHLIAEVRQRKLGRLNPVQPFERSLSVLWSSVLQPVLDFLGYTHKLPIDELPRLTWCTTGLLSFLPLHAAGLYDGSHHNALDLVVSSYTPTLSALLTQQSIAPSTNWGILAVGQEHTPGLDPLPGTKAELTIIEKHAQECCYLQLENEEATVAMVLEAMDQFSWVHMACHGSQDTTDPTQSAFHLHDGNLTLAMITKRSFINKGLAFLSACQTATGAQELPEEAVHLAAGMLMAGFPSVIGTMWSISDEDGPKVAERVYASLLKEGLMDHKDAARLLHKAVAELRAEVGETCFERWAPFIHIGS